MQKIFEDPQARELIVNHVMSKWIKELLDEMPMPPLE
jgi:hypothetical protein